MNALAAIMADPNFRCGIAMQVDFVERFRAKPMRRRPIIGGVFGVGDWMLGSTWHRHNGLDGVDYWVVHAHTSMPIGHGPTRAAALSAARAVLSGAGRNMALFLAAIEFEIEERRKHRDERSRAEMGEARAANPRPQVSTISRRRRSIFEASAGRCVYCGCELQIDGRWHVDHAMPRSLGGSNDIVNLVASCAPCNHAKRDRTDIEFRALLANRKDAAA